jgi:nicotinamide-nucleotide amidase
VTDALDLSALEAQVLALADALRARGWLIATAESCTGGLIAATCTAVSGSSDWFERGFVTYSNASKTELLGVDGALIAAHGAVSEPVALAMARGALRRSPVDLAVAVTGVAGPGGGSADKPVGTVWMALAPRGSEATAWRLQLPGDRAAVRGETVRRALAALHRATAAGGP